MTDMKQPEATPQNLYQITGNVADVNTVLIERAELHRLQAENDGLRALASGGIDLFERYSTFKAKCAELEAMLDAVGAGGVGVSIRPAVQADTSPAAWATAQDAADKFGLPLVPLYTAPQPTSQPLTDEKLYALYCETMKGYYVSALHYWRETEAHKFARAIEAAVANQSARQPLTEEQVLNLGPGQDCAVWSYESQIYFARAVEAAHGITGGQQ